MTTLGYLFLCYGLVRILQRESRLDLSADDTIWMPVGQIDIECRSGFVPR